MITGNHAPYYLIFHFFWAFVLLSTRGAKNYFKIDHNSNPRADLSTHGAEAVKNGKMTRRQLRFIERLEGAHTNSMENYSIFVGALLFATFAGVSNDEINIRCLLYTVLRVAYAISYLVIEHGSLTMIRSLVWWGSNITCLNLLWKAGALLNAH